MYQPIQFKACTPLPVRYFTRGSPLRRGLLLIALVFACFVLSPLAQAQLPHIFAADNPSGSVNSGGANVAYLQNTTGSDVTLTLDGNTITTKANRLNIFDRSSGAWIQKVILNPQSQPILPNISSTGNTFRTGLYSYYKLDEASNSVAIDAANGRTLYQFDGIVGSTAGIINTSRYFPGSASFVPPYPHDFNDFAPGANHFFVTFWAKTGTLSLGHDPSFIGRYSSPYAEWLVWVDPTTRRPKFNVTADGLTATTVEATTAFANTTSWYFIAAGWDGVNVKISVNGGPYATASFAGPVFNGGRSEFFLGSESGSNPWFGQIDEVAIWIGRNDLTISEVQQLYNNGAGLPFSSFY
jgi:Concanavalin A-like lectin/glucanases superfamily